MRLAALVLAHANPEQLGILLEQLRHERVDVYVHVDKKSAMSLEALRALEGVHVLDDEARVEVTWGTCSVVDATLALMREAHAHGPYDRYWLLSGQDLLLMPVERVLQELERAGETNYLDCRYIPRFQKRYELYYPQAALGRTLSARVLRRLWVMLTGGPRKTFGVFKRRQGFAERFYYGSQWWCLSGACAGQMLDYLERHPEYWRYFEHAAVPDEGFFQTLAHVCGLEDTLVDCPCYMDWSQGGNSPRVLLTADVPAALASGKFCARKFDLALDPQAVELLR